MFRSITLICLALGFMSMLHAQSLLFENNSKQAMTTQVDQEAWKTFNSRTEMLAATSIDDKQLQAMPTHTLARLVLNWQLQGDLYAFNSIQFGMDRLIEDYQPLSELVSREDAGMELLRLYQTVDPTRATSFADLADQGTFTLQLAFMETLMAHPSVLAHMPSAERTALLLATVDKYHTVNDHLDLYSDLNLNAMALLMGRTLRMEAPESLKKATNRPDWLDGFIDGKDAISREAVALIVEQSENLLNL